MNELVNNQLQLSGVVLEPFTFSHQVFGEKFYTTYVESRRLSKVSDTIPVLISDRLIDVKQDLTGKYVMITGSLRSYNKLDEEKRRKKLIISAFVSDIEVSDTVPDDDCDVNNVQLDGFVCKPVVYRKTQLGREITDILLAVNRQYKHSDYIPCICWSRNARYAAAFEVSNHLIAYGRIQSRHYVKKFDDETTEDRIAYEVSLQNLELVEEPADDERTEDATDVETTKSGEE